MESAIVEGFAGYEVWSASLGGSERKLALDLRLGTRYFYQRQKIEVELRPGLPFPALDRSFDGSVDWIDPLVGARVRSGLSERLRLVAAGDYGGFGWGGCSEPSWSIHGFVSYELSPRFELLASWRHLAFEKEPPDLDVSGPLVGAAYRF